MNRDILNNNKDNNDKNSSSSPAALVRQSLAKEVAEEVIENGIQEHSKQKYQNPLDITLTPEKAAQKHQHQQQQNRELQNFYNNNSTQFHNQQQQQKQQELTLNFLNQNQTSSPTTTFSPRLGSIAARLNVVSVRGLAIHPSLRTQNNNNNYSKVKICSLVFGPLGQQLCDVECDEAPVQVVGSNDSNNNKNVTPFSNQSFHFKKDGRLPVTVYLHPADPSVVIVHVWARIVDDNKNNNGDDDDDDEDEQQQLENLRASNKGVLPVSLKNLKNKNKNNNSHRLLPPRVFLGCAVLPVADILHRGPGTRILTLRQREPHEGDKFILEQSQKSLLGFISIDVSGPFAACLDAPPLQNDALNTVLSHEKSSSKNSQNNSNKNNLQLIKQQRSMQGVPPASVPALNLTNNTQNNTIPLNLSNQIPSALSTFTADIWIRSVTYVNPQAASLFNKFFFCELVSKTSKFCVLTTPKISLMGLISNNNNNNNFESSSSSEFFPRADSSITVTLARNEGFLLQLYQTNFKQQQQANEDLMNNNNNDFSSASNSATTTPPISAGGRLRPNLQGEPACNIQTNSLVGTCDLDAPFILSEFNKPTTKHFGNSDLSDRKSIFVYLDQKHDVGVTTAIVELVVRIVP